MSAAGVGRDARSPFVPLLLVALAVLAALGAQSLQLLDDRERLLARYEAQTPTLAEVDNVRRQFEAVSAGVVGLADSGHENARRAVEQLRRAGVLPAPVAR